MITEQQRLSDCYMNLKLKYYELKRTSGNCDEVVREHEILKSKYEELEKRNKELQDIIYHRDEKIHVLNKQVDSMMTKEGVPLQVDGKELGRYVKQEKYIRLMDEVKQLKQQVCR